MDRIGRWLWRRHRAHYVGGLQAISIVALVGTVIGPSAVQISIYFDLSLREAFAFLLVAVPASAAVIMLASRIPELHEVVKAWARGDRSQPVATWNAAVRAPARTAVRGVCLGVPLLSPLLVGVVDRYGNAPVPAVVAVILTTGTGVAMAALMASALLQELLRPVVEDTLQAMPQDADLDVGSSWSVKNRMVAAAALGSWGTGLIGGAAWKASGSEDWGYLVVTLASAAVAGWIMFTFNQTLFTPSFGPLQDLLEVTVRVQRGDFAARVPVTSSDEFGELAKGFNEMQRGLAEREALQAAFGSYVDPALAQRLLTQGSSMFEGEEVEVTVMFADVRSFTTYSEGVTPAGAVQLLNRLFDVMVPVLHEHGGHANHYLGDGLLAVFGAPQALARHADAAVAAAVGIHQRVRAELGDGLRIGIGINTGPVIAGTVGGGGRLEFTVIGDTVNTASRVEALTKETGDAILITEATRLALSPPRPRSGKRGEFEVRGKATKLTLHAVNPFPRSTR